MRSVSRRACRVRYVRTAFSHDNTIVHTMGACKYICGFLCIAYGYNKTSSLVAINFMIISLRIYNDDQAKFLIRNRLISYNFSFLTMVESIDVYRLTTYSLRKGCIMCTYTCRPLIRSVLIIFIRNQQLFLDSRYINDTSSD